MTIQTTRPRSKASNYHLDVRSMMAEADEVEIIAFRATLDEAGPQHPALASMDGFLLGSDGQGDVCVRVGDPHGRTLPCKQLEVTVGRQATALIADGVDYKFVATAPRCMILFNAQIISPDERLQPGTRLLAALSRMHAGERLQVVADFLSPGDDAEDRELFLRYFFPDLVPLCLSIDGEYRFARGHWGPRDSDGTEPYTVGVNYS